MAIKRRKTNMTRISDFPVGFRTKKNILHQTFNHIRRCHCIMKELKTCVRHWNTPTVPAGPWLVYKTLNSSLQFNGHKSPVLLFKLQTWWKGIIIFYSLWLETSFLFWVECNFFFPKMGFLQSFFYVIVGVHFL